MVGEKFYYIESKLNKGMSAMVGSKSSTQKSTTKYLTQ